MDDDGGDAMGWDEIWFFFREEEKMMWSTVW